MSDWKRHHLLSTHFTYGEMVRSQTATRLRINNKPTDEQVESLIALCKNVMEPVRAIYDIPLTLLSGFRCPELNTAIGSSNRSQHPKAEAADFEPKTNAMVGLHDLWRSIVLSDIPFDQCILEYPPDGWIHVSHVKDGPQRGKISIYRGNRYIHFTRQEIKDFDYDWE